MGLELGADLAFSRGIGDMYSVVYSLVLTSSMGGVAGGDDGADELGGEVHVDVLPKEFSVFEGGSPLLRGADADEFVEVVL